jgi:hypothetical protein
VVSGKKGKMTTYKLTYNFQSAGVAEPVERWFSTKKDAVTWATEYSAVLGWYPVLIEKFKGENNFTHGKTAHFPLVAIKHFFKGGMF